MNVTEGLWEWDRWLMILSETPSEYDDLQTWRIDRAIRFLVQRALTP